MRFFYHPEISFEDTNVIGNVYFANFIRWQYECRSEWLRETNFDLFRSVFNGETRIVVADLAMKFLDPLGTTVGDSVDVGMSTTIEPATWHLSDIEIHRRGRNGTPDDRVLLAKGHQRFTFVHGNDGACSAHDELNGLTGPAYYLDFPIPLDFFRTTNRIDATTLVRLQGKCRERFLAEQAPATLQSVIEGKLALHTSAVSLRVLRDVPITPSERLRMAMRLTHLKGGRLTVAFDYYLGSGDIEPDSRAHIATGSQSLCCKRPSPSGLVPTVFPSEVLQSLREFAEGDVLQSNIDESLNFLNALNCLGEPARLEHSCG